MILCAASPEIVYVGTSDSERFMASDAKSGRVRFNYGAKAHVFSPAVDHGVLYFGSMDGNAYALS